jgi:hypothetical protein
MKQENNTKSAHYYVIICTRTREELIESLRLALKEALEFNRQDALSAVGTGYTEEKITV